MHTGFVVMLSNNYHNISILRKSTHVSLHPAFPLVSLLIFFGGGGGGRGGRVVCFVI